MPLLTDCSLLQELWAKFFMLIRSLWLKHKAFFWRLNQGFHMTLVNKCQVSSVKPQNILLRKVVDSLIFHTNKLRHGGDTSEGFLQILHSCLLSVHTWRPVSASRERSECQQGSTESMVGVSWRKPTILLTSLGVLWDSMGRGGCYWGRGCSDWVNSLSYWRHTSK